MWYPGTLIFMCTCVAGQVYSAQFNTREPNTLMSLQIISHVGDKPSKDPNKSLLQQQSTMRCGPPLLSQRSLHGWHPVLASEAGEPVLELAADFGLARREAKTS